MKMYLILVVAIVSFSGLIGCSDSDNGNGGGVTSNSESLSYDFTFNGCKTGKHTFSSLQAYCAGLEDDQLNNGCAYRLRCEAFKARCDQSTTCS